MSQHHRGPWAHPETGAPVRWPAGDGGEGGAGGDALLWWEGLPLLVPGAEDFAARHLGLGHGLARVEWLPVDAPDAVTPHLSPRARVPAGPLRALAEGLRDPAEVCAAWGADFAPDGPLIDVGCGLGTLARRAALDVAKGERSGPVLAFDRSPSMVKLARSSVQDGDQAAFAPAGRRRLAPWPEALPPLPAGAVEWAVGDALRPPITRGSAAWVHLGNLLDMVPEGMAALLEAVTPLLMPGGLLTLSTPFDEDATPLWAAGPSAEAELSAAYEALGLHLVAEEDPVYWLIREYDRGFRLLLCRCLALRKPLARAPRARPVSGATGR